MRGIGPSDAYQNFFRRASETFLMGIRIPSDRHRESAARGTATEYILAFGPAERRDRSQSRRSILFAGIRLNEILGIVGVVGEDNA